MKTDSPTKRKSRLKIVNSAKTLFLDNGIANTSIKDIMENADMERKTFYTFFKTKEEISEYIFKDVISNLTSVFLEYIDFEPNMTGFEKVKKILTVYNSQMASMKEDIIYTVHYDYYFRKEAKLAFATNLLTPEKVTLFTKCIEQGINDNSIELNGRDPFKVFTIIVHSMFAYTSRMLFRGHIIKEETGVGEESIPEYVNILINGIKK